MSYGSKALLLKKFVSTIPSVKKELGTWATLAKKLPEPLCTQALLSIEHKAFHCVGGSVYAHYPGVDQQLMLRLIVAFQTISDYLDNLCDRLQISDPKAFRLLHQSFIQALTPGASLANYYALYPHQEDSYLPSLVHTCQDILGQIPHYCRTQSIALRLAEYYCELQILKHVFPGGEGLLRNWVETEFSSELQWNEWSAACGSTLGIFYLFALGFQPVEMDLELILEAYFPWIQGLHILLDYLIDIAEDQEFGDLNFIIYYPSEQARNTSLRAFAKESKLRSQKLPSPYFHQTVVDGLIALYGSDPKVREQNFQDIIKEMAGDHSTLFMLRLCRMFRALNLI